MRICGQSPSGGWKATRWMRLPRGLAVRPAGLPARLPSSAKRGARRGLAMSELSRQALPLELARQLDSICDRFEDVWLAGTSPRIEDFLAEVSEENQPVLLRELLALQLDHRLRQ